MWGLLEFVFVFVCILAGAILLYSGVEDTSSMQTLPIIVGAVLLALALVALWSIVKSRLKWRQRLSKASPLER